MYVVEDFYPKAGDSSIILKSLASIFKSYKLNFDISISFHQTKNAFSYNIVIFFLFFFKLGFTPCKAEQPLRGMELQEKEAQKG